MQLKTVTKQSKLGITRARGERCIDMVGDGRKDLQVQVYARVT